MTCVVCRAGTVFGFLLVPDVWRNAYGDELVVRHEVPLCATCLPRAEQAVPPRPDAEVLEAEVRAWRCGVL
jgi:hypothetical protein